MKKQQYRVVTAAVCAFAALILCALPMHVDAQEQSTVEMHGLYEHPYTGNIEDSGGESSMALGQSMVDSMVSESGLLESDSTNQLYITFSFSLMNSISEVDFMIQEKDETEWKAVTHQVLEEGDDSTTFCVPVESEETVIRATCFVEPMGRSVVFYIIFDNKVEGNSTGFAVLEGTTGLTIGGMTDTSEDISEEVVEDVEVSTTTNSEELVLGNGFWIHAFMLFVSVNILTAILVLVVYFSLKVLFGKNKSTSKKKFSALDRGDSEDDSEWDEEIWEDIEGAIGD